MLKHPDGWHDHELTQDEKWLLTVIEDMETPPDLSTREGLQATLAQAISSLLGSAQIIQGLHQDRQELARKLALAEQALTDTTGIRLADLYAPPTPPASIAPADRAATRKRIQAKARKPH